jgi:hypothetical protein
MLEQKMDLITTISGQEKEIEPLSRDADESYEAN